MQIASAGEPVIEIIPVYNRPASELQPLIMPFLEGGDQLVANGSNFIVKTAPQRLQSITSLIRKLDNPQTSLQISIIQSRELSAAQLNAGANVELYAPLQNPGNVRGQLNGYYQQGQSQGGLRNTQTIRTLDGAPAVIKTGNAVPVTQYQTYPGYYGYPNTTRSTQYVEATTGFEVTPRLAGQQVVLDVAPWSDAYQGNGQFQTQSAATSIRANLGEWVEIGAVNESSQNTGAGVLSYNRQAIENRLHILVKVDIVN
jgi:type II secretory pathway component GspD/PulD (secretin)